jgi:hypothetical protein
MIFSRLQCFYWQEDIYFYREINYIQSVAKVTVVVYKQKGRTYDNVVLCLCFIWFGRAFDSLVERTAPHYSLVLLQYLVNVFTYT